ncbi:MAG TPA: sigma-54 dependent transcriptional regulator [Bryobacteraceae bacterium]|jgi:DNA-binding NtrC family response regulator|nr:sigma-54 dependent transcriptional regulator [Bryobacteraceae bacterium]
MNRVEPARVLWIAAEDNVAAASRAAEIGQFALEHAAGIPEALEYFKRSRIDAAVVCFPLPEYSPADALEDLQSAAGGVPLILWDPCIRLREAVRLIRSGASDVLGAEVEPGQLAGAIVDAMDERRSRISYCGDPDETWRRILVGSSQPFQEVVRMVRLVGSRRCTVLISGETGTGKEMVARALHMAGPRGRLPMVSVCCSALPENLLEAELFGHVRGAFTGAINQRIGRFEQANGGTLFLDEIGDMPLELQAKLLRVLQEREFQRLGSSETIRVDVRVVAATNADLLERVHQCRFREDLYYRLNVVPIHLPPLRARAGDVAALTHHFMRKICRLENLPLPQISPEALARLAGYAWPGNVRQLENAVERAIVLGAERAMLYPSDFPFDGQAPRAVAAQAGANLVQVPDDGLDFERTVAQIARNILEQALRKTNGNKKMAADLLGLKRTTLAAKLRSLETCDPELDFVHCA